MTTPKPRTHPHADTTAAATAATATAAVALADEALAAQSSAFDAQQRFVERIQKCSQSWFERHSEGLEQLVGTLGAVSASGAHGDFAADAQMWHDYFLGLAERVGEDMRDGLETMMEGMRLTVGNDLPAMPLPQMPLAQMPWLSGFAPPETAAAGTAAGAATPAKSTAAKS